MEILIKIWGDPPKAIPIDKAILTEGTFTVMRITLSKMKQSLCTIDNTEARHQ